MPGLRHDGDRHPTPARDGHHASGRQLAGAGTDIASGLLTVFIRHTSTSLLIQENADPDVHRDFERFLARLIPDGDALFRHRGEGPDDKPAHVRSALTQMQLSLPVIAGHPALGTWQALYVHEYRHRGHRRQVVLHLIG